MDEKKEQRKKEEDKEINESKMHDLLKKSEISLWLDTYDDIFSDFDPRPYFQRILSDDFLFEAKKASRDTKSGIELKFLIAKDMRNAEKEALIKKRLHEHFKKHLLELQKEVSGIIRGGVLFVLAGIILMFIATFILIKYPEKNIFPTFLVVLLEPAGWFLLWEGLNQIIFKSSQESPDLKFYEKMSKCEIGFFDY